MSTFFRSSMAAVPDHWDANLQPNVMDVQEGTNKGFYLKIEIFA